MLPPDKDVNDCQDPSKCWPITPVPLANRTTIVNKRSVLRALGWGGYDETGAQSRYLRQVDLRLHSVPDCSCPALYDLFTMVGERGQDTCKGDSGERHGRNI